MKFIANFGSAAASAGFQFFDETGLVGVRSTVGVVNVAGGVYVVDATPPAGAAGILWTNAAVATKYAVDDIQLQMLFENANFDGYTFSEALLIVLSTMAGKTSGMGANAPIFRAINDAKARIIATLDASGNRTAVTIDAA